MDLSIFFLNREVQSKERNSIHTGDEIKSVLVGSLRSKRDHACTLKRTYYTLIKEY